MLYRKMTPPIFISYARSSAMKEARALKLALGDLAFLDQSEIETREPVGEVIAGALMGARHRGGVRG